jgi:F-type H+-transporting ATPase subunit gamma
MATLKQIRSRIKTARNIQQITRAMKMVAAARLKKATDRVFEARPYSEKLRAVMESISQSGDLPQHPLLERRNEVRKIGLVVMTSDRGLAGAFNSGLIRKAADFVASSTVPVELICYGRKAYQFFSKRGYKIRERFSAPSGGARLEDAVAITKLAREIFESGDVDAIYVCNAKFFSAIRQVPQLVQLLPIEPPDATGPARASTDFLFEPDSKAILDILLPRYFQGLLWQSMLESTASEFGARMTAMTSATDSAGKMINSLTLRANRERQAAITKEILEVVGGAEALKA